MGEAHVIIARKMDQKSQLALSSLIHALHELDTYAVARIVTKDMKEPQLVVLIPNIEHDFECLYDVPLPFAEDVRNFQFPPLDRVITTSGATLTKHRNLPNDALNQAMSDYVDAMDISEYGKGDDGFVRLWNLPSGIC
jgi:ATP-dependent DNA helicase 2 subunit 2